MARRGYVVDINLLENQLVTGVVRVKRPKRLLVGTPGSRRIAERVVGTAERERGESECGVDEQGTAKRRRRMCRFACVE